MTMRPCKDCDTDGVPEARWRPTPWPGPRCSTHHRAVVKARRLAAHGKRVESNFGLTSEQYWALYELQGGVCFICRVARGTSRRLAVDHDHRAAATHGHDPKQGCPLCVRALICSPCNQTIGRLGVEALARAMEVLVNPPAQRMLHRGPAL